MSSEEELAAWLREQVEARKRAASPKVIRSRWHVDAFCWAAGTGILDANQESVAVAKGGYVADHIAANDPEFVIAQCEADLAILDDHAKLEGSIRCRRCDPDSDMDSSVAYYPCRTVRLLGYGYRFRSGYRPEWAPQD